MARKGGMRGMKEKERECKAVRDRGGKEWDM